MSEAEKRRKDRQELHELFEAIEPAKNEDIARRAISIADYWLNKAENQAKHIQDLEARNSKQPTIEPKKGKWISKADQRWHCSLCDGIAPKGYRWNYCPNCGARMEEGAAE